MPHPARRRPRLERPRGLVVVALGRRTCIADAQRITCESGAEITAACIAVAAVKRPDLTRHQRLAVLGKHRRLGFGNDGAGDAVAADAHRRDARIDLEQADIGGVEVGQCRVHVVGTGRDQVHAVDLDADAIVGQTANRRQAGNPARAVETHARHIAKKRRSITGGGLQRLQCRGVDHGSTVSGRGLGRCDDDAPERRLLGKGERRQRKGNRHGEWQTSKVLLHDECSR